MPEAKVSLWFRLKSNIKNSKVLVWLLDQDIDVVFVFLTTFIWLDFLWWQRLLIAAGITGVYKMVVADIKAILRVAK